MRRGWLLLALAAAAAGGCGQKGPLYLPDKGGKVVTSAPPANTSASPAPKPTDKDQDQDQNPPPPK
ncbi:MAG TPA: lipoprotein [Steroidobacteraceae bacterium]|nr:lipoprotein [Steroidobacteraceae bacterium]